MEVQTGDLYMYVHVSEDMLRDHGTEELLMEKNKLAHRRGPHPLMGTRAQTTGCAALVWCPEFQLIKSSEGSSDCTPCCPVEPAEVPQRSGFSLLRVYFAGRRSPP
ncbi:hypothetical protein NQD34_016564 [Periophthalmus magnuspinnatus]|nr:hypothetical protein NQD34_016564 [Periophthalmus magnuspinnatus]